MILMSWFINCQILLTQHKRTLVINFNIGLAKNGNSVVPYFLNTYFLISRKQPLTFLKFSLFSIRLALLRLQVLELDFARK